MKTKLFGALALLACSVSPLQSATAADVLKCRGAAGEVLYTDGMCTQGARLERVIMTDRPSAYNATFIPTAMESQSTPQTPWAGKRIVRTSHPDTESIRNAHLKMQAIDAMR